MQVLQKVHVKLPGVREYDIEIGTGLSAAIGEVVKQISPAAQVFLITDTNVAKHHLDKVKNSITAAGVDVHTEILPAGERVKNLSWYKKLILKITEFDDARDLVVIALGGGVIGDLAGFVAATYKRGVKLLQVPTTLLACVDSSVGGKTGVDLPAGKNLLGSFYQPHKVIIDLDLLATLPLRELRTGYAEVVKTALIFDADFFQYLEEHGAEILKVNPNHTAEVVCRCCCHKAETVARDERDTLGHRALLNLGHTFGHAAETCQGYRKLRHGEAVAVGLVCSAELSAARGLLSTPEVQRIESLLKSAGLPVKFRGCSPDELFGFMKFDKKFAGGVTRFILINSIGAASLVKNISKHEVMEVLKSRTE